MTLFNWPLKVASAAALLAVGMPQAAAQMAQAAQPPFQPITLPQRSVDYNSVVGKMEGSQQDTGQQAWRITKGKDDDKLPPEFQWDTPPTPINTPFPIYPFELLKAKVAGKVGAFFIIGPDGRVVRAELEEAASPEFGLAVRAMLDACRFKPARKKDGTAAYTQVGIEYDFQPKGRSGAPVKEEARLILRDLEKKPANIINLKELDQPLKPVSRQAPSYPLALQKTRPAGDAVVEFFVDADGYVQLPHIKSCSAPEFGYAAVQAVAAWKFEAPQKGGKTVVVRAEIPIGFEGKHPAAAQK